MKKLEILQELPKCDTDTQNEHMPLEKWHLWTCTMQGCHRTSIYKKCHAAKYNEVKQNKMRSACNNDSSYVLCQAQC